MLNVLNGYSLCIGYAKKIFGTLIFIVKMIKTHDLV